MKLPKSPFAYAPSFFNFALLAIWLSSSPSPDEGALILFAAILSMTGSFLMTISILSAMMEEDEKSLLTLLFYALNGLVLIGVAAGGYRWLGFGPDGAGGQSLSEALYFSTVTFTTLGYGDMQPSLAARPLAAIQALYGYVFLGLLVSVGSSILDKGREKDQDRSGRR